MAAFTDRAIEARKLARGTTRELWWDDGQPGLYVLISSASKTYRSRFRVAGRWHTRKLAAHGELIINEAGAAEPADVQWARGQTKKDRALGEAGIDPRKQAKPVAAETMTYEAVVDRFIRDYAKPRQRSWFQTERTLKRTCAIWLERPFDEITKADAKTLVRGFLADGHTAKARNAITWLRCLWRWAHDEEIIATDVMASVRLQMERRVRDRVWNDTELAAIWRAANTLGRVEASYVKLILLLAPRKTALAEMRWSELDDKDDPTLWTTPFERTKSKKTAKRRTYLTPLPPLAARLFKSIPRRHPDFVFPSTRISGKALYPGAWLMQKLINAGAPADFNFHCARHTAASFFKEASDFEVGLILNHASANVTSGYRHGSTGLKLKLEMLCEWSDHIEALVTPKATPLS